MRHETRVSSTVLLSDEKAREPRDVADAKIEVLKQLQKFCFEKCFEVSETPIGVIIKLELGLVTEHRIDECSIQIPQSVIEMQKLIAGLQRDSQRLEALEAAGVDNWEGYSDAVRGL